MKSSVFRYVLFVSLSSKLTKRKIRFSSCLSFCVCVRRTQYHFTEKTQTSFGLRLILFCIGGHNTVGLRPKRSGFVQIML